MSKSDSESELVGFLKARGMPDERIEAAANESELREIALEWVFVGEGQRFTAAEFAERAGIPIEFVRKFWRAFGFPVVDEDVPMFTNDDVAAIQTVRRRMAEGISEEVVLQLTRVIGSSLARIAEAEVGAIQSVFSDLPLLQEGQALRVTPEVLVLVAELASSRVDEQSRLLEYGHRLHLLQAARRHALWQEGTRSAVDDLTVGFADLEGFTALSRQLSARELAEAIQHFESIAYDTVNELGGTVVKIIGDEVMFVDHDAQAAVEIGLQLAERCEADDTLNNVRVGIASGEVVSKDADFYGPVVNLASRIVSIAFPGTVVASDDLHSALESSERFEWRELRPRRLKGIGRVTLWSVRRAGEAEKRPPGIDWIQARRQQVADIIAEGI